MIQLKMCLYGIENKIMVRGIKHFFVFFGEQQHMKNIFGAHLVTLSNDFSK